MASSTADRSKRWPTDVYDWHHEVSRVEIQSEEGDVIVFVWDAYGMGIPNQALTISIKSCPEGISFGIDGEEMDKLAAWLLSAKYAERDLREGKEKHARRLEKERRVMDDQAKIIAQGETRRKADKSSDDKD